MPNIYRYWDSDLAMKQFGEPRNLFRSETYFLEKIMHSGISILDVGCGTGALYQAMKEKNENLDYVGVDISEAMLKRAKELNPNCHWIKGNFLENGLLDSKKTFDLTFATGVFQHEPETDKFLSRLLGYTKEGGICLFDIKLFHSHETVCDIKRAYCDLDNKLYFIIFNLNDFINLVLKYEEVEAVEIYGYYSGMNASVRLPSSVLEPVCSAHVLIHRSKNGLGDSLPLSINLPKDFIKNYGKKRKN